MTISQPQANDFVARFIFGLVITLVVILWCDSINWVAWQRKGQQNVFWREMNQPEPKPPLSDWTLATVPLAVGLQFVASAIMVWRYRGRRILLAIFLLIFWLGSALFSFARYHSGPLSETVQRSFRQHLD